MAGESEVLLNGKTILELNPHTGVVNRTTSFLELHVDGQEQSVKVAVGDLALVGKTAKEVVQQTHPEIVTDAQFIAFITGAKGTDGTNGTTGAAGKSAYELAQDDGFVGTVTQWLLSLKGTNGTAGTNGRDGVDGTNGTNGAKGNDGKSAYEVAQADGFVGTQPQWLASLKGQDGVNGTNGTNGADGQKGDSALSPVVDQPLESFNAFNFEGGHYHRFTFAGEKTYSFSGGSELEKDLEFHGRNVGPGNLTLTPVGGFTLNAPYGGSLVVPPGGTFTVKIVSETEADLFGAVLPPV